MEISVLIEKLNVLYHKRQTQGLTAGEIQEQNELRRQYLDIIKGNVKKELGRIRFVDDKDGCSGDNHHPHSLDCNSEKH